MSSEEKSNYNDMTVFFILISVGLALYAKTTHVPWLFDDQQNIVDNPVVHSVSAALSNVFGIRGFAYLTFAFNYQLGGLNVTGYHVVNIAIHILASWFVWLLAKRAFTDPGEKDDSVGGGSYLLPAGAAALLFLSHPLQTQAVNYIVQRMTIMAALFALMSVYAYCRARESRDTGAGIFSFTHAGWYGAALFSLLLALLTKQNAAVVPAGMLLFDWLVLNNGATPFPFRRRIRYLLPLILLSCLFVYLQVGKNDVLLKDAGMADFWIRAEAASANKNLVKGGLPRDIEAPVTPKITEKPPDNLQMLYFATEWTVLWDYIRLLVIPYGQTFDYGEPLVAKVLTFKNVLAGVGLLLLATTGFLLKQRRPLAAFGILWFFVCLSVESTIIPLDAKVEHRLYLPMFGFAILVVDFCRRLPVSKNSSAAILGLVVVVYAVAGWSRNSLWSDPIAFALDGREKAPHNQRNHLTLATAYADAGRWYEAEQALRRAIPLRPYHYVPYDNLGASLAQQGKYQQARIFFSQASALSPQYPNAVYNYGWASLQLGDTAAALRSLQRLKELGSPLALQLGSQFTGR